MWGGVSEGAGFTGKHKKNNKNYFYLKQREIRLKNESYLAYYIPRLLYSL